MHTKNCSPGVSGSLSHSHFARSSPSNFTSLVLICNVEEVLSSVPVEAQEVRKDKTIDAKRSHLNCTLPDISSTYYKGGVFGHCILPGRYKQSGGED